MKHQAKAPSAGSTQATGSSRGLLRRAFAIRGASSDAKGTGAPAPSRARATLAALALAIAAFALTAAPASAASLSTEMGTISGVSYTSAHVTGKLTSPGCGLFCSTFYTFQYSKDPGTEGWSPGSSGALEGALDGQDISGDLGGLEGDTKYFVRLHVSVESTEADSPAVAPYPSFTTLTADPPTIPSVVATSVFSISASATGKVVRPSNSDDVKCHFEYLTDAQFDDNVGNTLPGFAGATPAECEQNPIGAADAGTEKEVTAHLAGLQPGTSYHLRLVAENAAPGVVTKEAATFTTAAKVAAPTVTAIDDATGVKYNSAEFTGKVQRPGGDDPGLNTNCHFEYITDAQFLANEGSGDPGFTGSQPVDCEQNTITSAGEATTVSAKAGLKPGLTYHLRLVAENAGGADAKVAAATFTTPEAELPTITIDPVAGGTFTTAHVTGTVNVDDPGHDGAYYAVEVSTDGGVTWPGFLASDPKTVNKAGLSVVEKNFTGLQPSTTYTFRIASTYSGGFPPETEANGEMAYSPEPNPSITTEPLTPPTAENLAVTGVTATSAHFSATVDPHAPAGPLSEAAKKAFATHWEFVCAPECKNANGNPIEGTVQGEEGPQIVTGDAKRLEPNALYEVSLVIHSEGGDEAKVATFPTLKSPPTVKQAPGAPDGEGGYTLQGVVNPNNEAITACEFEWGPDASKYAFKADCSPLSLGGAKPVTVEAHLTGLNPGVDYHALLVVTYGAGSEAKGVDQAFKAALAEKESCPNAQLRKESNSLALPECRAYEVVTPPGKEGNLATLADYSDSGLGRVHYETGAGNIAGSGQSVLDNDYVSSRTATGWETTPNLNGPSGSLFEAPSEFQRPSNSVAYSADLLSTIWAIPRRVGPPGENTYLRNPDGTFALIGDQLGTPSKGLALENFVMGASADLSHVVFTPVSQGSGNDRATPWGPGVYEYVGTGNSAPRRVDLDNFNLPVSSCGRMNNDIPVGNAEGHAISADGSTIVFTARGASSAAPNTCAVGDPPTDELWARVNATTSFDVSASQCNRPVGGPNGACNAPSRPTFVALTPDGSRVFFTTTQQLVDEDIDQANDLYACDIPTGNPAPIGEANSCASLREVSGASSGAEVDLPIYSGQGAFRSNPGVPSTSEDGSSAFFVAKGALVDNKDGLGEKAVAGDHNLYAWRQNAAHPDGQTTFVARLDSNDLVNFTFKFRPQATPDGRYLVFTTASQLVATDTDTARDVYRYDAETGEITRVSAGDSGIGGNAEGIDAAFSPPTEHNSHPAISGDGQKIAFTTSEALLPADGNGEPDAYLWTPGHVLLITTGSVGGGSTVNNGELSQPTISDSGQDVYFSTPAALTPADSDGVGDVYDARIGGGFSFAQAAPCSGEACQPGASGPPAAKPLGSEGASSGNPAQPKQCPKGKARKHGKCVKKPKRHSGKKHHGKKASHKQGGGK